jgi:hypothetical protein
MDPYGRIFGFPDWGRWFKMNIIQNLAPTSASVVQNAAYHNVQLNPAPTSLSRKSVMVDWFSDHGVPFSDQIYMFGLCSLINHVSYDLEH